MEPQAVVARFFAEIWNEHRLAAAEEIVAPECVTHQLRSSGGATAGVPRGPTELREHVAGWLAAFPDMTAEVEASVAAGDRVVSWVAMRGTHAGPWLGVPPTGRRVTVRTVVMHRVAGGRIVEDWVVTESLGLFQQLGVVEPTPDLLARATRR
jgi:steroid delta-isomerase-like uncharacterized protein